MKSVFIDAGHGGSDPGALGYGKKEADINLSVAKKVEGYLKPCGVKVYMSRTSNATLSLSQRVSKANSTNANCFVSIHCNAFNGSAKGVETYSHVTTTNDLATDIHNEIIKTKAYTANRGVKTANYYVIRNTKMRASLVELAFIDHKDDNNILVAKQDVLAKAIAKGICKHLGVSYKEATQETDISTKTKIQVDGKVYSFDAKVEDGTTYVKLRDFEQAGYKINYVDGVATIDKPYK